MGASNQPDPSPSPVTLSQSEERYRDYFENAKDAIYVHDLNGRYTMVNKAGEQLIGYTREEILQMRISDVVPRRYLDQIHDRLKKKLADHSPTIYEVEAIRKDGTRVPVEVSSRLIYENGVPVAVQGSARDISERKRAEQALRASQLQLQQSQKLEAIGQLAGGVAHDFNNMLTAIIGYTDLLSDDLRSPEHRTDVAEIRKAADRAAALTRQLLAFSRRQVLQPSVVDLAALVDGVAPMLRRLIGEDVELSTRVKGRLRRVRVDPNQFEQVLLNLVVNARDAMPKGGSVSIELANAERGAPGGAPAVEMAVTDSGTGMDPHTLKHLFEPFFTTKPLGKGTGLGLATVYGIVKQSGGHIRVVSQPDRGATFTVVVPATTDGIEEAAAPETAAPAPQGHETILLAEDEPAVRSFTRSVLTRCGYRVLDAEDATTALRLVKGLERPVDLVVTDVVMPDASGPDLFAEIAGLYPESRVLYMSGYPGDAMVIRGLDEGVAFLAKPFTADRLARRVRGVLDGVGP